MHSSHSSRTAVRLWVASLVAIAMLLVPLPQARPAAAADATLVVAALHVLEQEYVDPVQATPLLNAAIAILRKASNLSTDVLPDIPATTSETEASAQFTAEFARAAQAGGVSETQLAYTATVGMLASLRDSHTYFLDPAQLRESRRQLFGNPGFTGIGVTIIQRKDASGAGWIFIEDVFPGSPAKGAGLQRFDKILQVDGKPLQNMNVLDASQVIRGPEGSTASLVIQRGGQTLPVTVVRAPIRVPPVEGRFLAPGVAYLKIFEFSQGAGQQLRRVVTELRAQDTIRSVVLDLRGDPGGLIVEAANVGGVFLPPRTVLARITERGQQPSELLTAGRPLFMAPQTVLGHSLRVYVDGRPMNFDVPPTVIHGRVLVPLGGIFEQLGATVDYNAQTQHIKAVRDTQTVELTIGSRLAQINGEPKTLDVPAFTLNGRTMVPLRFISEALGASIQWTEADQSILIGSRGAASPPPPSTSRVPLVVLVDGGSASASEILAGAFRDEHRATIVGDKTAGALGGSVTVALPEGGMSVTVERILSPNNTKIEQVGIAPDVPVTLTVADMERGQDTQLEAALHALGAAWIWHLLEVA